jgi:hypothetical protein
MTPTFHMSAQVIVEYVINGLSIAISIWSYILIYYLWTEKRPKYREFIASIFFSATTHIVYMLLQYFFNNSIAATIYGAYVTSASMYITMFIRLEILGVFQILDAKISPKSILIAQIVLGVYVVICCGVFAYDAVVYNEFSNFLGYIVLAGLAGSTSVFANIQTWYIVHLIYVAKKKAPGIMKDASYVINLMFSSIIIEWAMLFIYVMYQKEYSFVKVLAALAPRIHMNFVVLIFAALKKMVFYGVKLNKAAPAIPMPAMSAPDTHPTNGGITLSN